MQGAGVWLIGVGPETGSRKIMEEIEKNMDLEKVKQVVQWCQKVGINTYANFMIGFPLETVSNGVLIGMNLLSFRIFLRKNLYLKNR